MMEAEPTCETPVYFYDTTRRHNPKDCLPHPLTVAELLIYAVFFRNVAAT
jgi:hypothetical protein